MPSQDGKSVFFPLVLLAIIYVISIYYFHMFEGWNYLDAAYFTTATMSTVGYGDFVPQTPEGKVGAMVLIFSGVSVMFYVISHLALIRERTIDPHVQKRLRLLRSITEMYHADSGDVSKIKRKMDTLYPAPPASGAVLPGASASESPKVKETRRKGKGRR